MVIPIKYYDSNLQGHDKNFGRELNIAVATLRLETLSTFELQIYLRQCVNDMVHKFELKIHTCGNPTEQREREAAVRNSNRFMMPLSNRRDR